MADSDHPTYNQTNTIYFSLVFILFCPSYLFLSPFLSILDLDDEGQAADHLRSDRVCRWVNTASGDPEGPPFEIRPGG